MRTKRLLSLVMAVCMLFTLMAPALAWADGEETQPQETQPQETQPQETQPQETQPQETQPQETQPKEKSAPAGAKKGMGGGNTEPTRGSAKPVASIDYINGTANDAGYTEDFLTLDAALRAAGEQGHEDSSGETDSEENVLRGDLSTTVSLDRDASLVDSVALRGNVWLKLNGNTLTLPAGGLTVTGGTLTITGTGRIVNWAPTDTLKLDRAFHTEGTSVVAGPVYTVHFELNGGTSAAISDQDVIAGRKANDPGVPTRTGYDFAGWVDQNNYAWTTFNTPINEDTILTAQWTAKTFTIKFAGDATATLADVTATYDQALGLATLTQPGHVFAGYTLNDTSYTASLSVADVNALFLAADANSGEVTLTSAWTAAVATVNSVGYNTLAEAAAARVGVDDVITLNAAAGTYTLAAGHQIKIAKGEYAVTVEAESQAYAVSAVTDGDVTTYTLVAAVATTGGVGYASLADAVAAAADGATVTLLADTAVASEITITGKTITLALNGKNITSAADDMITIAEGAGLTITGTGNITTTDSTALNNSGTLTVNITGTITGGGIVVVNFGIMTLTSGTITDSGDQNVAGIWNHGGSLTMDGGTVNISGKDTVAVLATHGGSFTMNAGQIVISGNQAAGVQVGYGESAAATPTSVEIKGGSVTAQGGNVTAAIMAYSGNATVEVQAGKITGTDDGYALYVNGNAYIEVSGGKVEGELKKSDTANGDLTVSGGTFTEEVPEDYCAEGFIPKENDDGTYGVKFGSYVARVDDQGYETFAAAAEAANGAVITLEADIVDAYTLTVGETLKVELNGKTLTVNAPTGYVLNSEPDAYGVTTYTSTLIVAKIGETPYMALADALAVADTGDTVEILAAGTYTLPNLSKNITLKGAVDGVVFSHTDMGNVAAIPNGASFDNLTFNFGNNDYHGFQHNGGLTFKNCTFNGKFFTYGTETYTNCTFVQDNEDYNMWVYGGAVITYDGCTFINNKTGKFLNVYCEQTTAHELVVKNCMFINKGAASKAAINIKETCGTTALHYDVDITGTNTVVGSFPANSESAKLIVAGNGLYQVDARFTNGTEPALDVDVDTTVVVKENETDLGTTVTVEKTYPEFVATVTVGETTTSYASLNAALAAAATAHADATVTLLSDIDLTGETWTPVGANGYSGAARAITIQGAGKTITGLSGPLFGYTWSSTSIKFYDLTVRDSALTGLNCGGAGGTCNAAFIGCISASTGTVFSNCHVINCTFSGSKYTGAFYGYAAGYSKQTDGPVFADITITNCSVKGCTISGTGSSGAIAGHATGDAWTKVTVTGVTATNNTISGETAAKTGILFGTAGVGQSAYNKDGGIWFSATESGNMLKAGDTVLTGDDVHEIGRIGSSGGTVTVTPGGSYTVDPTQTSDPATGTIAPTEDCEVTQNVASAYTVTPMPIVAKIGDAEYTSLQKAVDAAHKLTGDVTITLVADIEGYTIVKQKACLNLTIDGDNKTLAGQIIVDGNARAAGTEALTIQNIKFKGDKTNFYTGTDAFVLVPSMKEAGKPYYTGAYNYAHNITVKDCSFTSTSVSLDVVGIKATSGAGLYNLVMTNVTGTDLHSLAQLTATTGGAFTNCTVTNVKNGINISGGGGEFVFTNNTITATEKYGIRIKGTGDPVVKLSEGNTIVAPKAMVLGDFDACKGTFEVTGGSYSGELVYDSTNNTAKYAISGGRFTAGILPDYCADEYMPDNGKYDVDPKNTVKHAAAKIVNGEVTTLYETFADAYAATRGNTGLVIVLLENADDFVVLEATEGNKLIVDANGKTNGLTVTTTGAYVVDTTVSGNVTTYTVAGAVAQIGDTYYASFLDAVAAANASTSTEPITIMLLKSTTEPLPTDVGVKKSIVVDSSVEGGVELNLHSEAYNGFTAKANGVTVTFTKNVTITGVRQIGIYAGGATMNFNNAVNASQILIYGKEANINPDARFTFYHDGAIHFWGGTLNVTGTLEEGKALTLDPTTYPTSDMQINGGYFNYRYNNSKANFKNTVVKSMFNNTAAGGNNKFDVSMDNSVFYAISAKFTLGVKDTTYDAKGTLTITGSRVYAPDSEVIFTSNDTVKMDATSKITAKTWTNNGVVNVDTTGLTDANLPHVIVTVTGTGDIVPGTIVAPGYVTKVVDRQIVLVKAVASVTHEGVVTYFETFEQANTASVSGDTITLLADVKLEDRVWMPSGVTLDGDVHTIKPDETSAKFNDERLITDRDYAGNSGLTLINLGNNVTDVTIKNVTLDSNGVYPRALIGTGTGSTLTLENVTLNHTSTTIRGGDALALNGDCTIKGTFSVALGERSWSAISFNTTNETLELDDCTEFSITDDTRIGTQPIIIAWLEGSTIIGAEDLGMVPVKGENVQTGFEPATSDKLGNATTVSIYNFKVGNAYFTTFAPAAAKAGTEGTVEMFADPAEGDTFTLAAGETLKVVKNDHEPTILAEGAYIVTFATDEEGVTTYSLTAAVASITKGEPEVTTYYTTLADAIEAAENSDTVKLLEDVALTEGIEVAKTLTLDMNEKTIRCAKNDVFSVTADGDMTITGNGTINGPEHGENFDGKVLISVSGKLTLENGTLIATGAGSDGMYGVYVLNNGTAIFGKADGTGPSITSHFAAIGTNNTTAPVTITVYGGTYTAEAAPTNNEWWSYFCAPIYAASNGTYTINGGTFNGYYGISSRYANVDQTIALGNATFVASSCTVVFVDDAVGTAQENYTKTVTSTTGDQTVPADYKWVEDGEGYKLVKKEYVAQIGDDKYESLAEAIAAAQDGDTITLLDDLQLDDVALFSENKTLTLDLNEKTLSSTVDDPDADTRTLTVEAGNVTVKNGTIVGRVNAYDNGTLTIAADATVNGTVIVWGDGTYGEAGCKTPTLNVYGNITSTGIQAISTNGTDKSGAMINIYYGAEVTGNDSLGIYLPSGKLNISGGTITGTTAVYFKSTDITISGGTLNGNGAKADYSYNGNGANATGEALVIDSCNYPNGVGTICIEGGTFTSANAEAVGNYASQGAVLQEKYISGGTFSSEVPLTLCKVDHYAEANTDGTYTVILCSEHVDVEPKDGYCDKCGAHVASIVTVTTSGNGGVNGATVSFASGAGVYAKDDPVTVQVNSASGYNFVGWFNADDAEHLLTTNRSYSFAADGENDYHLVAVFSPVEGGTFRLTVNASKFTVQPISSAMQRSYLDRDVTANTMLTVEFLGGETFLYWINSAKKIVSKSKTYTFRLVQNETLTAVYMTTDEHEAVAQVVFVSSKVNGQVTASMYCGVDDDIDFPAGPYTYGKTFKFWSLDGENAATEETIYAEIRNGKTQLVLYPVYESASGEYTVTVISVVDNVESGTKLYEHNKVGDPVDLQAEDIEGKTFQYWADDLNATADQALGFTKAIHVRLLDDKTYYAIYGDEAVAAKPVVTMTASTSEKDGKYVISFNATRSVPEGYTLESVGILIAAKTSINNAEEELVLNSTNSSVNNQKGSSTIPSGTQVLNNNLGSPSFVLIARAYIVVTEEETNIQLPYYSDILEGSYNSFAGN